MGESFRDGRLDPQLRRLDRIIERIAKQRAYGIQACTFLNYIKENDEVWDKYRDSLAGNVVHLQIVGIESGLCLYCARHWDKSRDAQSLPNVVSEYRKNRDRYALESVLSDELIDRIDSFGDSPAVHRIRVHRTEYLAHLMDSSRDRNSLKQVDPSEEPATVNELIKLGRETALLSELLWNAWVGGNLDIRDSEQIFRGYLDAYWTSLPVFRNVE